MPCVHVCVVSVLLPFLFKSTLSTLSTLSNTVHRAVRTQHTQQQHTVAAHIKLAHTSAHVHTQYVVHTQYNTAQYTYPAYTDILPTPSLPPPPSPARACFSLVAVERVCTGGGGARNYTDAAHCPLGTTGALRFTPLRPASTAPVGIRTQTVPTTRARSVRNDEPHPEPQRRPRSAGPGPLAFAGGRAATAGYIQQAPRKTSGRGVPLHV